MKSKIFATILLVVVSITSSFAIVNNSNFPVIKQVRITRPFQKLVVNSNVHLVLVQDESKSIISITGNEKDVESIEITCNKDQLTITSKKNTEGIVVYVPVTDLSLINLASGAAVSGEGNLQFDNLTVIVDTDSYVNLKAAGNINLKPADNCDVVYEKIRSVK